MIYAEKIYEDCGSGYYNLRYVVYNGDIIGSYGVHYGNTAYSDDGFQRRPRPQDPEYGGYAYGASRDYHRVATPTEIEARAKLDAFYALPDDEKNAIYDADAEPDYCYSVDACCYHDNKVCVCDGSSLVECIIDNDKAAYMLAAMMAEVER